MLIASNERVAIIGQTGCGKSYLARHVLLPKKKRLVVCDAKGQISEEGGWGLTPYRDGIKRLAEGKPAQLIVPPLDDDEEWETLFNELFKLRYVTVYIDEMYNVGPPRGSRGLRRLYTMGRTRHISVWGSSQRPRFIPGFSLSEAGVKIMFRLEMWDDREFMAKNFMGPVAMDNLVDHQLIVKTMDGPAVKYARLNAKVKE
jgi:hypothetical protein